MSTPENKIIGAVTIDVSSDNDQSSYMTFGSFTPVAVITPSTLTSTTLTFSVSYDFDTTTSSGTFVTLSDNNNDVSVTVATNESKAYALDPTLFYGLRAIKIKTDSAEASDREFKIVGQLLGDEK